MNPEDKNLPNIEPKVIQPDATPKTSIAPSYTTQTAKQVHPFNDEQLTNLNHNSDSSKLPSDFSDKDKTPILLWIILAIAILSLLSLVGTTALLMGVEATDEERSKIVQFVLVGVIQQIIFIGLAIGMIKGSRKALIAATIYAIFVAAYITISQGVVESGGSAKNIGPGSQLNLGQFILLIFIVLVWIKNRNYLK